MDRATSMLERARERGVNPLVYWLVRARPAAVLPPLLPHEPDRPRAHPARGPGDPRGQPPLVPGPVRHRRRWCAGRATSSRRRSCSPTASSAWFLNSLGAFPIDRGNGDQDAMGTAREILERGDVRVIFPEGTRIRPGALGRPSAASAAWRWRPARRSSRSPSSAPRTSAAAGASARTRSASAPAAPLHLPARSRSPRPQLAGAVTDRIWPWSSCSGSGWAALPPIRRAAVIGAGSWGTGLAVALRRAGVEVELGCRTAEQADAARRRTRATTRYLPGVRASRRRSASLRAADLELAAPRPRRASPSPPRALPAVARRPRPSASAQRAAVLVAAPRASSPPHGDAARGVRRRARQRPRPSPASAARRTPPTRSSTAPALVVACAATAALRRASSPTSCQRAGFDVERAPTSTGVELAGAAKNAAVARRRRRRRPPARTPPAPPPARSSPRSTPTRARSARGPRRSPAWPAPATSSPPSSPPAAATAAPASCWARRPPPRSSRARPGRRGARRAAAAGHARASAASRADGDGLADVVEGRVDAERLGRRRHRAAAPPDGAA